MSQAHSRYQWLTRLIPNHLRPWAKGMKSRWIDEPVSMKRWERSGWASPAPKQVKLRVLVRYGRPTDTWLETGTFLGDTTSFLSERARRVITIEPEPELAARAANRFQDYENLSVVFGLSEHVLDAELETVSGPVSFWLDGHYSRGITFLGPTECPVEPELTNIAKHMHKFTELTNLIDDALDFDPSMPLLADYPSRTWLANWADSYNLDWTIEHDILGIRQR